MPIAIVKTGRRLLKREVVLIVILTDQSSSHKKPLLILSMRICGQFSLKPQLLLVIGSIPFFLASCLQLTLPLQVCSKALAELHKKNEHILYSLPGMESRKNIHQSRPSPVGLASFLSGHPLQCLLFCVTRGRKSSTAYFHKGKVFVRRKFVASSSAFYVADQRNATCLISKASRYPFQMSIYVIYESEFRSVVAHQ
jgi:hypothetical protein